MKKLLFIAAAAIAVSCGNKQTSQQQENDSTTVKTESVEQESVSTNTSENVDAKVIGKIQEFYKDYVFGKQDATDEVIAKYCTKKLAKKLADDYEYEGGGYAIWDFRSDAQDGDSDVQEVTNVESLGSGVYKVVFNDMGTKSSCNIKIVIEGDNILFDEISK